MPSSKCECCGGTYQWKWEEAFEKFGFGDGEGQVETYAVEVVLTDAGYKVNAEPWGIHNVVIQSIRKDGREFMPDEDSEFEVGYADPHDYLPPEIIELLDRELPRSTD